jgi:hypothetical protein
VKRALIASLITATITLAAQACGPTATGSSNTENTADETRVQFMGAGVFRWNTAISARKGNTACRWRLETEPKKGLTAGKKPRVVDSGSWGDAKIKVAKPDTVNVFLVYNKACGYWGEV